MAAALAVLIGVATFGLYLHLLGKAPWSAAGERHLRALKDRRDAPAAVTPMSLPAFADLPRGMGRQPGVADLALLRTADAQGHLGKWKDARDTLDLFFSRFGQGGSALAWEARLAQGWVNENLSDRDRAIEAYSMVASRAGAGDAAQRAKAQLDRLRQAKPGEATAPAAATASTSLSPRLPNLLVTQKRYAAPGSPAQPAPPVVTAPVNSPDGTTAFSLLGPIRRGITVELAPLTAPTVAAEEAYTQSPAAPDDTDAPAAR
jgi:hypothetical protein